MKQHVYPKAALISLGCPKNLVDSEVILGFLQEAGFPITYDEKEAELIIINTCGFIEDAQRESVDTILELIEEKKKGRALGIVVAGCLAQRYGADLKKEIPEIDLLLGTGMLDQVGALCCNMLERNVDDPVLVNDEPVYIYSDQTPRIRATLPHVAYIKIAEGCDNRCSYCLIPSLRGRYRSRQIPSIVREAEKLVNQGVREINLIAQDTTAYGKDLPPNKEQLVPLLKELVKLKGLDWIRLLYTYPDFLTGELIELIAQESKICSYIDMPIQHINDEILGAMNRRGTRKSIEKTLSLIRKILPQAIVRTSIMVGFPGETEAHFNELLTFVSDVGFDRLGVFSFSPQKGTAAGKMKGKVSKKVKNKRQDTLLKLQAEISLEKNRQLVSSTQEVIIDGIEYQKGSRVFALGRTRGHAPDIDGVVKVSGPVLLSPGDIQSVKITKAETYDLIAEAMGA